MAGLQLRRCDVSERKKRVPRAAPPLVESPIDASLLDIVDHVLTKGVVVTGDLVLGVADVDLVYLRLSAVLCAADRVLGAGAGRRERRAVVAGSDVIASRIGFSTRRRSEKP
jgi:hypothetical protein